VSNGENKMSADLIIHYSDSPDRARAGNGLESFPLINKSLEIDDLLDWWMTPAERVGLIFLLEHLKPKVAIEIGTMHGGSLQVLSHFCDHVYSIDTDPSVARRLEGKFPNVEYLTGQSDQILPPLIHRLNEERAHLSFVLVDGDHSTDGVRKDIDNLLRFRPTVPFYIVMHDSFNPQCRLGLRRAQWASNRYVHAVELDFIAGIAACAPAFRDELWGGLALGILLPYEREGRFEITARSERTHRGLTLSSRLTLKPVKNYARRTLLGRAVAKALRLMRSSARSLISTPHTAKWS
jgi:hypothetical protein